MNKKQKAEILDYCLARVARGEDPEAVLSEYPEMRDDIFPLLGTARSISGIPRLVPSKEFVSTSKTQLLRRIYCETHAAERKAASASSRSFIESIRNLLTPRRLSAGLAMTLAIVLLVVVGQFTFFKPAPAVAASCYLRILSGEVSIQEEPEGASVAGTDGMSVTEGSIVTTAEDSHALLAFFDGSTIKLEAGTTLELVRIENTEDESPVIILKQWLGRTWSRVEKMTDSESRYEIETPSATAVVRGTLFETEVTGTGETSVATTEGLVSVIGEEEEVFVPPANKTTVKKGTVPSIPSLFQNVSVIRIITEGSVVGSINDPSGSSTGSLPDGTGFNQITGSSVTNEAENRQVITLTEPSSGDYNLVLRYLESGSARFTIEGIYEGETIFSYSDNLDTADDQGIIVNFGLTIKNGELDFGKVKYQFLDDESPEKLVNPAAAKQDNRSNKADEKADDTAEDSESPKKDTGKESAPGQNKTDNEIIETSQDEKTNGNNGTNTDDAGTTDTSGKSNNSANNGKSESSNDSVSKNDASTNPGNGNSSGNSQQDKTDTKSDNSGDSDNAGNSGNSGNSENKKDSDSNGNAKNVENGDTADSGSDSKKNSKDDKSNNGKAIEKTSESDNTTGNTTNKKNLKFSNDDA